MDFITAAAMDDVNECLRTIEGKLYERGTLIALTKDNEADVTISYEMFDAGFGATECLLIRIKSETGNRPSGVSAEDLCDYVMGKVADVIEPLDYSVREKLEDIYGAFVLFNGELVY
jgi:hypothetical protein